MSFLYESSRDYTSLVPTSSHLFTSLLGLKLITFGTGTVGRLPSPHTELYELDNVC